MIRPEAVGLNVKNVNTGMKGIQLHFNIMFPCPAILPF